MSQTEIAETEKQIMLASIVELSQKLGGSDYVIGGGGNSSVKVDDELWIKPSGSRLKDLTTKQLVGLSRTKLLELFNLTYSDNSDERESQVKEAMFASILPGIEGRPSVESPLHECIPYTYVYHTHPPLVNAFTCAKDAAKICSQLFPEALWIPYVDPGYTLSTDIKQKLGAIAEKGNAIPKVLFLENHGIFVGADSVKEIEALYNDVMNKLFGFVSEKGGELPSSDIDKYSGESNQDFEDNLKEALIELGETQDIFLEYASPFDVAKGPLTPDHVVYMKAFPFVSPDSDSISAAEIKAYFDKNGFMPQLFVMKSFVAALGKTQAKAQLTLEIARDSYRVTSLTSIFGGVQWMTEKQWKFIEGWEVEKYRQSQT